MENIITLTPSPQALARRWKIFPCVSRTKRPATSNGYKDATQQEEKINAWWTTNPSALIGIPATLNDFFAVDIDRKNGVDGLLSLAVLGDVASLLNLPGPQQRTPSGGLHLLYQLPEITVKNNASKLGPGLDLRSTGYICTGAGYTWLDGHNWDAPIPPAPEWLLNAIAAMQQYPINQMLPSVNTGDDLANRYLNQAVANASNGNRNDLAVWLACQLRDNGIDQTTAESLLTRYASSVPQSPKPYTIKESIATCRSIYKTPARKPSSQFRAAANVRRVHPPNVSLPKATSPIEPTPAEPVTPTLLIGDPAAAVLALDSDHAAALHARGFTVAITGPAEDPARYLDSKYAWQVFDIDALQQLSTPYLNAAIALGPLTPVLAESATIDSGSFTTLYDYRLSFATIDPNEFEARITELATLLAELPEKTRIMFSRRTAARLKLPLSDINRMVQEIQGERGDGIASIRNGSLCFMGAPLGNWSARIEREQQRIDGENPPRIWYKICGSLSNNKPLQPAEIPAEEFASMGWIPKIWGASAIIYQSKSRYHEVARAIQEISIENMQTERIYEFTGWYENQYLSASGALTDKGLKTDVTVDVGLNNFRHYALQQTDNPTVAIRASLEFIDIADNVTAPLWAAMYASVFTSVRSLNAVLWVYGATQSGKSTITHLALTHFGAGFVSGRDYQSVIDWTSTATSIEGALFRIKDAPLVIDDFAPQFASRADAASMHKKAAYVVRSVGNRSARSRSKADLTEKTTRIPRGLVISTAENPLIGQSVVGRIVYLNVPGGLVFADRSRLDAAQQAGQSGLYAQAMAAYIMHVAKNNERYQKLYLEQCNMYAEYARKRNIEGRLPGYYSVLSAGAYCAITAFHEMGIIARVDAINLIDRVQKIILNMVAEQANSIAAESPLRKFAAALESLHGRGRITYISRTGVEYTPSDRVELVGWYDTGNADTLYIDLDVALAQAKNYWRDLDENLDILPDALARQLLGAGMIAERDGTRLKVSKFCAGRTRWVLALNTAKLASVTGIMIHPLAGIA